MNNQPTATRQSLDQRRAAAAWKHVEKCQNAEELTTTCKKTCTRILTSGLGQTIAFALTKNDDSHKAVLEALTGYLLPGKRADDLLKHLIEGSAEQLRRRTDDALAFLTWMARLADGKAKREKQGGGT